jgi:hypothetical protein
MNNIDTLVSAAFVATFVALLSSFIVLFTEYREKSRNKKITRETLNGVEYLTEIDRSRDKTIIKVSSGTAPSLTKILEIESANALSDEEIKVLTEGFLKRPTKADDND